MGENSICNIIAVVKLIELKDIPYKRSSWIVQLIFKLETLPDKLNAGYNSRREMLINVKI